MSAGDNHHRAPHHRGASLPADMTLERFVQAGLSKKQTGEELRFSSNRVYFRLLNKLEERFNEPHNSLRNIGSRGATHWTAKLVGHALGFDGASRATLYILAKRELPSKSRLPLDFDAPDKATSGELQNIIEKELLPAAEGEIKLEGPRPTTVQEYIDQRLDELIKRGEYRNAESFYAAVNEACKHFEIAAPELRIAHNNANPNLNVEQTKVMACALVLSPEKQLGFLHLAGAETHNRLGQRQPHDLSGRTIGWRECAHYFKQAYTLQAEIQRWERSKTTGRQNHTHSSSHVPAGKKDKPPLQGGVSSDIWRKLAEESEQHKPPGWGKK